jgi:hypothetical protein
MKLHKLAGKGNSILTIPYPQPSTLNPPPSTLNPQPSTLNPQPSTLNPQPSTLNPHTSIRKASIGLPNSIKNLLCTNENVTFAGRGIQDKPKP